LVTAVHRFSTPVINPGDQLSFEKSFKSCATPHENTRILMLLADGRRQTVKKNMAGVVSHPALSQALKDYIPLINQVLLSCKVQPDVAKLDKSLLFSWCSGIENGKTDKKRNFDSEALMFELALSLATYGLSESNVGHDACAEKDYPQASRQFARTAGVFKYMGSDLLPDWMANANGKQRAEMENESPAETNAGACVALSSLYMAMAQQMAVATVLAKPGAPNYALLGKLCLGVAEDLDSFVSTLRSKSPIHMQRMDPSCFTTMTFSINVQRAASLYFLARSLWTASEYGLAIAAMYEATAAMRTRSSPTGKGLPEIERIGPLQPLAEEVDDFRAHMSALLESWEKDNGTVYFEQVPASVPKVKELKAIQLKKAEEYALEERDPLPMGPKAAAMAANAGGRAERSSGWGWNRKTKA